MYRFRVQKCTSFYHEYQLDRLDTMLTLLRQLTNKSTNVTLKTCLETYTLLHVLRKDKSVVSNNVCFLGIGR